MLDSSLTKNHEIKMTRTNNFYKRNGNARVRRHRKINKSIAERRKEIENELRDRNYFDRSLESVFEINQIKPLKQSLRSWVNCHGITTRAVNDLLKILIKSGIMNL